MTFDLMQKKSCIAEIFKTGFPKIFQPPETPNVNGRQTDY